MFRKHIFAFFVHLLDCVKIANIFYVGKYILRNLRVLCVWFSLNLVKYLIFCDFELLKKLNIKKLKKYFIILKKDMYTYMNYASYKTR